MKNAIVYDKKYVENYKHLTVDHLLLKCKQAHDN
jgi:hypothetical protein